MNMIAKHWPTAEPFAPTFAECAISTVSYEADLVSFTLKHGCIELDCEIKAIELTDSICIESQFNPENGFDIPFEKLEVSRCVLAVIVRSDAPDVPDGMKFKLTDSQVYDLNEQLGYIAVERFEDQQKVAA